MQTGLLTFLPVYLAYELGYSPLAVGICLTVLQVSGFIAAPIAGHLSDKLGRKSVVMGSMTLSALTIVGMAFAGKSVVFIIFIALIGFFLYATRAVIQAWAIESTPRHLGGSGVGLLFGLQALGGGISPVVFGMIADHYGIYAGFYFLACTVVVANLLVFLVPSTPAMQDKPVAV
jgi:MFS family permease